MNLKHVTEKNYYNEVKEGIVLVDFYADWCGPCKMLAPELEKLSIARSDIKIIKIDSDQEENLSREFGVMSIPTLILYKDGKVVNKTLGYQTLDMLNEWLSKSGC